MDNRICRICDGGPGNDGCCLCGFRAYYDPKPRPQPRGEMAEMISNIETRMELDRIENLIHHRSTGRWKRRMQFSHMNYEMQAQLYRLMKD